MSSIRTDKNENRNPSSLGCQEKKDLRKALSSAAGTQKNSTVEIFPASSAKTRKRTAQRHQPEVFRRRVREPLEKKRSRILVHPALIDEIITSAHGAVHESRILHLPDFPHEAMMNTVILSEDPGIEELVVLARERDEDAMEELHRRFLSLILSLYQQMELKKKVTVEEWELEARLSLINCIELYAPKPGSSFAGYYKAALKNRVTRLLRDAGRKGRQATSMTFSDLESLAPDDFRTEDFVQDHRNHKEELEAADKFHAFLEDVRENHSERAAEMLLKRARGYRIQELAGDYEMTPDAVSGLFRRLRRMYRRFDTQYNQ